MSSATTPITADEYVRLKTWFQAVCDLPDPAAQQMALRRQGADEPTIVRVLALLGHSARATHFAAPVAVAARRWLDNELAAGDTLGAWRLRRQMGQGGMGRVFEAQRNDGHYEQRAAIKLLLGFSGPDALERLKRERQILARLEHPNIARLLDGGKTPAGRPYLVMEYADGQAIDAYCTAGSLDLNARLRLFDQVCDALAYAHRQLVIHCDIKPSNVLVDGDGRVRLIDFGISRLEGEHDGLATALTPGYASPEQAAGQIPGVPSDIYGLGRLLQDLMTEWLSDPQRQVVTNADPTTVDGSGRVSLERDVTLIAILWARTAALWQSLRVRERPLPTVPAGSAQGVAGAPAQALLSSQQSRRFRWLHGSRWSRQRRELAAIIAKASAHEPTSRYESVAGLQRDLQRLRAHLPVQALPQTATYVVGKLLRRRWAWLTAGCAALLMAAGFTLHVMGERNEAQFQRQQAEGLIEFMLGDLRKSLEPVGRLDVLDSIGQRAINYYEAQAFTTLDSEELSRRARALHLIGQVRDQRGQLREAQTAFEAAARTTAELLARAPSDPRRLFDHGQSQFYVGFVAYLRGEFHAAEAHFTDYQKLAERLVSLEPGKLDWRVELASAQGNLGVLWYRSGQPSRALEPLTSALAAYEQLVPQRADLAIELANTLGWIALAHEALGDLPRALALEESKLQRLQGLTRGHEDFSLLRDIMEAWTRVGQVKLALGDRGQAVSALQQAATLGERLVTTDPANLVWRQGACLARVSLGAAQLARRDAAGARATASLARSCAAPLMQNDTTSVGRHVEVLASLALLEYDLRMAPSAELERGLAAVVARSHAHEARGASIADYAALVAACELLLGDLSRAAADLTAARERWSSALRRVQGPASTGHGFALTVLARAQLRVGEFAQATVLAAQLDASTYRHPEHQRLNSELRAASARRGPSPLP